MNNNNLLKRLPPELRAQVSSLLPQEDVLTCFRLKVFHSLAKEIFYKNITIDINSNSELLTEALFKYNIGRYIHYLQIYYNSKHNYPSYFNNLANNDRLLLCFPNLKRISFRQMNSFYILASLRRLSFKYLEEIDIEWASCNTSIGTQKNFYAALLHHSKTKTKIEMPFSESQSSLFNFDNKTDLKQFFASFKKSPKIVYQPESIEQSI